MSLLKRVAEGNPEKIIYLPTFIDKKSLYLENTSEDISLLLDRQITKFSGIFDAATIGMWLLGIDPRNNYGFTKYRATKDIKKGGTFVDPSKFNYVLNRRGELFGSYENRKFPIYNLHVHTKDIHFLGDLENRKLNKFVSAKNVKKISFSFQILTRLLLDNLKNKSLLKFIAFSPILIKVTTSFLRQIKKVSNFRKDFQNSDRF
jgi:hypothetical protein